METINNQPKTTKELWQHMARNKSIMPVDVAAYAVIRALRSRSNEKLEVARGLLLKSFSPIINPRRIANGEKPFAALEASLHGVPWSRLMETVTEEERGEIRQLLQSLAKEKWTDETYVYILVRQDLPKVQQVVQAAHAAMALGQTVAKREHDAMHQNFYIFGVENLMALDKHVAAFTARGVKFVAFREPDMGNEITAVAVAPMRKSVAGRSRLFGGLELLTL